MFIPAVSSGQAATLSELSNYLKKGETVEVTVDGRRERGAFEAVADDGLILKNRIGRETRYAANRVQRVRRIDSLKNGMLIGLAAGMTAGFTVALNMSPNPQLCPGGLTAFTSQLEGCGDNRNSAFATLVVAGYGTGTIIDSVMKKTVYQSRPLGASVSLTPVLQAGQQGLRVAVRFQTP